MFGSGLASIAKRAPKFRSAIKIPPIKQPSMGLAKRVSPPYSVPAKSALKIFR